MNTEAEAIDTDGNHPHENWSDIEKAWEEKNRLLHALPQKPHYAPFSKYECCARDGIKMGLHMGFRSLARMVTTDSVYPSGFLYRLENFRKQVSEFEGFGYNVTKLREILDAREVVAKSYKTMTDDLKKLVAKTVEGEAIESRILEGEKDIEKLKKEVDSRKSKIEIKKAKFEEDSSKVKKQFAAVAKAPWN